MTATLRISGASARSGSGAAASPARRQTPCARAREVLVGAPLDNCDIDAGQREQLFALVAAKRAEYRGRLAIRTTQFTVQPGERCMAGRTVFYIDPMGVVSPCTVTDNTIWREAVQDMTVGQAIAFYRSTLTDAPPSSCSARLSAVPVGVRQQQLMLRPPR